MKRTRVNLSNTHLTTADMGYLIPFEWYDCLPNDIAKISTSITMKAQPMIAPLMHRVNILTQYYFVPYRILWDEWAEFITGGDDGTAAPTFPTMKTGAQGATLNGLENYLGIPLNQPQLKYSALPIRAYTKIWNDHYKVEDIENEYSLSTSSGEDTTTNKELLRCHWARDRFTRAKTFTQRGEQINVPIYPIEKMPDIQINNQYALYKPTITITKITTDQSETLNLKFLGNAYYNNDTHVYGRTIGEQVKPSTNNFFRSFNTSTATITPNESTGYFTLHAPTATPAGGSTNNCSLNQTYYQTLYFLININWGKPITFENAPFNDLVLTPVKLNTVTCRKVENRRRFAGPGEGYDNITYSYEYITITPKSTFKITMTRGIAIKQTNGEKQGQLNIRDLRVASALQRFQEKSLKYGSEYEDYCRMEFKTSPRDSRLQKSEYLGGSQGILQISEVIQTTDETNHPLGSQGGYGIASVKQKRIRYRCPEHGIIIGLMSIRPETIYTQGLDRALLKRERFDYWTRELVGIGAQEILQQEIYATKNNEGKMFGYDLNGNYREYYSKASRVSGNFLTDLNFWHLGRFFNDIPTLNKSFIEMNPSKRPFAIQDGLPAFLCYIQNSAIFYRPIPRRVKNILK